MHKSVMRQLLPLAVVCLLAAQLAAGARITPGRSLLRQLVPENVTLGRQQFVQATWALQNKTCDEVSAQLNNPFVNNTLAQKVILDFQAELTRQGWPEAAKTVVAVRQPCVTFDINGTKYASYRVLVRFNSTTTTAVKDTMYLGAVSGPCVGGYNKTLYSNVAALFKDFKVSQNNANRQNVWNNGVPNWIEYAAPNMTVCQPKPSPSPSPSPVPVDSPSPSPVASPSPSPSPSPTPNPCPSNSTLVNGTCTCDAGLLPSVNGTDLISCTAGTTCPAAAPVAIKNQAGVTTGCITTTTPCPASNSLIFYSGSPSVRIECRNNPGGCNVPGFSIQVTNAAGTVIGCANTTSNDCPFVAFRTSAATGYTIAKCQDVTSCPVFSATGNTDFTVPLLPANASLTAVPKACVTVPVPGSQACPASATNPLLNYPVEIMFAEPTAPVCGSDATQCTGNRVVACYASGTDCPSTYALRLFQNTTSPQVAECRQLRTVCDLTAFGMGTGNPNGATYNLPVLNGANVEGCMITGTTTCPAAYPFPSATGSGGALTGCSKTPPPPGCTAGQIPLFNTAGTQTGCQPQAQICPAAFPVTIRENLLGLRVACAAAGIPQCPPGYSFPAYGVFSSSPNNVTITNCFKDGVVSSCSSVVIASGDVQPGASGPYTTPVTSNSTGSVQLRGCLQSSVTTCPSFAAFSYLTFTVDAAASTTSTVLDRCVPASEAISCPGTYPKPGFTKNALTACINYVLTGANLGAASLPRCPTSYPVTVTPQNDPALIDQPTKITACLSQDSTCWENSPTGAPFTIVTSTPASFCVPIVGLTTCANYPVATYQNGLALFRPDGSALIGCTQLAGTCPSQFPISFSTVSPAATVRCQASVAGTCASVSNNAFPIEVRNPVSQVLTGCQNAATQCAPGQIPVANDTTTNLAVTCLAAGTTVCTVPGYTFPLYSTTAPATASVLVRCIPDPNAPTCNGAALGSYNIEVFAATGTNVAGCLMQSNPATNTRCPANAPNFYLVQGAPASTGAAIPFTLSQCRPTNTPCAAVVGDGGTFSIPIMNAPQVAPGDVTVGCLASPATTCPTAAAAGGTTTSPYAAPFLLLGTSATSPVVMCRQVATAPTTGTTCATFLGTTAGGPGQFPVAIDNGANLVGCAQTGAACASGFLASYTGTTLTGCITACPVATANRNLYNAAGTLIGCGDANTCLASPYAGGVTTWTAGKAAQEGCMVAGATACPDLGALTFSVYAGGSSTSRPSLTQCWVSTSGGTICDVLVGGNPPATGATVEIANVAGTVDGSNPLRGCTTVGTQCPDNAPFFMAPADGALVSASQCVITRPTCLSPLGVPVVAASSTVNTGPIIGCLGTAGSLGQTAAPAPVLCPNVVPAPGTFNFEVYTATQVPNTVAGQVVQCLKPDAVCSTGAVSLNGGTNGATNGCLINLAAVPACSTALGSTLTLGFYGPTSATDATARLESCNAPPSPLACPTGYSVPVTSDTINAVANDNTKIVGCIKAGTTACPVLTARASLPMISGTGITGCRSGDSSAVTCPGTYAALCDRGPGTFNTPNNAAVCPNGEAAGCSLLGGTVNGTCYQSAPTNNYPVAKAFPIFAVQLTSQASPTVRACYTSTITVCGVAAIPPAAVDVYTARAVSGSPSALRGCTDNAVNTCTTWWASNGGGVCVQQA